MSWRWLRRAAPWGIAGASVAALLYQYPIRRIVDEIERGDTLAMVPAAVLAIAALWLTATAGDRLLLQPVVGAIRWRDLLRGKAGVSVLNALGLAVTFGGYGVWIQRRFGCAPGAAAGLVLMIALGDLAAVALLVASSVLVADTVPAATRDELRVAAPLVLAVVGAVLLVRPRATSRPLLTAWREVPRLHRVASVGVRCGNVAILIVGTWAAARGFGIPLPLGAVAAFLPLLLVVGALPINIAGIGPVQAAWVVLFADWAPAPQILAFQFLWHLVMLAAILARGAPFLRAAVDDVARA